jgi:arsenite-transporting ATPase
MPEEAAGGWFQGWARRERHELDEIAASFPVPRFHAPLLPVEPIGVDALRKLASALYGEEDPARVFQRSRPIQLIHRDGQTLLAVELPNSSSEEVDVVARGDELLVRVRDAHRRIALPASVAGRPVSGVRLAEQVLEVTFAP